MVAVATPDGAPPPAVTAQLPARSMQFSGKLIF